MKRYKVEHDQHYTMAELKGDLFNPEYVNHLTLDELRAEEIAFEENVAKVGVWGCVIEEQCKCCGAWRWIDSCCSFVGMEKAEAFGEENI